MSAAPTPFKKRLNALKNLQDQHSELEAKFREEILALDKKYLSLYQPLYNKRHEIVIGNHEPTDEEAARVEKEEDVADEKPVPEQTGPGISDFWLTILKTHPVVADLITDRDAEALKFLTDIRVSYLDGNPGFRLDFTFAKNTFFSNTTLSKIYFLMNSPDVTYGDVVYDRAEGCKIEWEEGQDLTIKIETKKQRHKGTNKTRIVKKTVPAETFFSFFNPPKAPAEPEGVDDDELEEIEQKLEHDYEIGETIKEKLIPRAIDWFTGKALEYEDIDFEGDWDGEDYNEDDDVVDDDDDDNYDDVDKPAAGAPEKPECKQQ